MTLFDIQTNMQVVVWVATGSFIIGYIAGHISAFNMAKKILNKKLSQPKG